jgi:predicted DNA-binding protein (MmcQ/YjbR family)
VARREPDPFVAEVIEHCRAQPGVTEAKLLGETIFRVRGRAFAFIGRPDRAAVTVKPPPQDVERLLREPRVRRARYIGRFGWLTVTMLDEGSLRLALALVDQSYRLAAAGARRRWNGKRD